MLPFGYVDLCCLKNSGSGPSGVDRAIAKNLQAWIVGRQRGGKAPIKDMVGSPGMVTAWQIISTAGYSFVSFSRAWKQTSPVRALSTPSPLRGIKQARARALWTPPHIFTVYLISAARPSTTIRETAMTLSACSRAFHRAT